MSGPIHPRTVITKAIVAKLRNPPEDGAPFPTQAGEKVEHNWPYDPPPQDLPRIFVWANTERIDGEYYQGLNRRVLDVNIGVLATGETATEIDDFMDSVALEVERALLADPYLQDDAGQRWTRDIRLTLAADKDIGPGKGNRLVGGLAMRFEVEYAFLNNNIAELAPFLRFRGELVLEPYLHPDPDQVDANADVDLPGPEDT